MFEFALAVLILELTPGPNMAYLATVAVSQGRRAGLKVTAGVAVGLSVHAMASAVGLGILVHQQPVLYEILRWTGVLFLIWLAVEGWMQARENSPGKVPSDEGGGLFWRGLWTNVFNPKSILFFVTVVPRFAATAELAQSARFALLGLVYVVIATAIHSAIVLLASTLQPWLTTGRRSTVVRRILAVALLVVALWLAWDTAR